MTVDESDVVTDQTIPPDDGVLDGAVLAYSGIGTEYAIGADHGRSGKKNRLLYEQSS